jgi:hypothetical protein
MSGEVVHQFTTAGNGAKKGSEGVVSFTDALGNIKVPDLGGIVQGFDQTRKSIDKATKAANDFYRAVSKGGSKSGSGKSSGLEKGAGASGDFAKAAGGPVNIGETYLIGEKGPELFTPWGNGTIIPHGQISLATAGGSGAGNTSQTFIFNGVVPETVLDRIAREQRKQELMHRIGG